MAMKAGFAHILRISMLSSAAFAVASAAEAQVSTGTSQGEGSAPATTGQGAVPAPAAAPAPAQNATDNVSFGEIMVTARRVEEDIQRVPVTVVAVSSSQLERADVTDVNSLQKIVPGYQGGARFVGNSTAGATYRIRGLTGIATYFGDVPADFNTFGTFFDVGSVQALMGPQGTLFGQASNAGALVVTPRGPGNTLGGYVRAEVGNQGRKSIEGAIDIPIVEDKVLLRVAGKSYFVRGYIRDIFSGERFGETNYDVGRINLILRPFEGFENQTIFQYEKARGLGAAAMALHDFNMTSAFNATAARQAAANGMTLAQFNDARDALLALQQRIGPYAVQGWSLGCPANGATAATPSRVPGPDVLNVIPNPCAPSRGSQTPKMFINKTTIDLTDNLSIKNIFGTRWSTVTTGMSDSDNSRLILRETNPKAVRTVRDGFFDFPSWSNEVQLVGSGLLNGALDVVAGFFHSRVWTPNRDITYAQYSFNTADTVTSTFTDDTTNALYAQADFDLTDRLTLTAGLRQTWDHSIRTNYVHNPVTLAETSFTGGPGTPNGEGRWKAMSYTLGARYQLNADTMFFITNSKGHSSGGLQNIVGAEQFEPDSLNNLEFGAKTTVDVGPDLRVRMNVAGHYGWFNNVKVAQIVVLPIPGTNGTGLFTATTNAAKARVKGADFEFAALYGGSFELRANANYSKNKYTEYLSLDPATREVVDLSDTPFPNNPKWKYSISATYYLPVDEARVGKSPIQKFLRGSNTLRFCG